MLPDARFGAQQRKYMTLPASPQAPGQRLKLRLCFCGGRLLTHLPEQFRAVQSSFKVKWLWAKALRVHDECCRDAGTASMLPEITRGRSGMCSGL